MGMLATLNQRVSDIMHGAAGHEISEDGEWLSMDQLEDVWRAVMDAFGLWLDVDKRWVSDADGKRDYELFIDRRPYWMRLEQYADKFLYPEVLTEHLWEHGVRP